MVDQEYIEDSEQWGKYQNISLQDIVNEFMLNIQPDDYTSNVSRQQVILKARTILSELYFDVVNEVKVFKTEVGPLLNIILPDDYVGIVRLSYVDEKGNVHLMTKNTTNRIARDYLQADDYTYLFDDEGNLLEADQGEITNDETTHIHRSCYVTKDQKLFYDGTFNIDNRLGVINVSSALAGAEIIVEYISDGLENKVPSKIFVHKFAKKAMMDGIFYELISTRRNVPEYAIVRARKYYYNSKRKAKGRINAISYADLFKTLTEYT